MAGLHEAGLVEAGRMVAARKVSASELVEAALARIAALEPRLHAFSHVDAEGARQRAVALDGEVRDGRLRGPLHGVPVAVKDLCDTATMPTAAGMPMRRGHRPARDATVVRRLHEAGAVLIGKTELSEGALALHHPDVTKPVNPWRADLWTGSSSSGSGVAVAAGFCAGALGSDTGGSIRFPALCTRTVGLKPTWGRVSRHGVFPLSWTLDHVGPLTRHVADAAAMLGAIAGRDPADPTSLAAPVPDYLGGLGGSLSGVRIGFDERYATTDVGTETVAALRQALQVLTERGGALQAITMPPVQEANAAWTPICLAEAAVVHAGTYPARAQDYSASFREFLEAGLAVPGTAYAKANLARREFTGNIDALFEDVDLMLVPVTGNAVPTVDGFARLCPDPEGLEKLIYFTCLYDVSGHPTLTLPAGALSTGEPIGFQIVGGRLSEALLCRAGQAWEDAFGVPGVAEPT